ncbi:MAG: hypothetical protein E7379_02915 [Clostridiales bacterium]|nr:hypothetical protein [Clostridiales bacterium]
MTEQQVYEIREATRRLRTAVDFYHMSHASAMTSARTMVRDARRDLQNIVTRNGGLLAGEQRAYRMGSIKRTVALGLIPVGVLAVVGPVLTGATGAIAELVTGAGVLGAVGGFIAQRFYCTQERQEEMQRRVQERQRELALAQEALDRTASL